MSGKYGWLEGIRPAKLMREIIQDNINNPIKYFCEKYGAQRCKAELLYKVAKNTLSAIDKLSSDSVGLYISIPFCKSRCLYCSFVTHSAGFNLHLVEEYIDKLKLEIDLIAGLNLNVVSIYIGGGTPTILKSHQLKDLIEYIKERFNNYSEFTVEAGRPDTLNKEKLKVLYESSVDRICINPQSMSDQVLKNIGRKHTAEDIRKAYYEARDVGFATINMDVIAGLPSDSLDEFRNTIDEIILLNPENITIHTLSLKRGSRLNDNPISFSEEDADWVEKMLDYASKKMAENEYEPYYLYRQKKTLGDLENIGYSKKNHFNLYNIIMMEELRSVFSAGAGAVTKIVCQNSIERIFNFKEPDDYIKRFSEIEERKSCLKKRLP